MDTARDILSRYRSLQLSNSNEAQTRFEVIDQILFNLLGWSHDDISVEERVTEDKSTTFADYVIRTAGTSFVIEAKKAGVTFEQVPNVRRSRMVGRILEGKTGEAVTQARDYCRKLSIPFAVVTNGAQWIIFPASRVDGVRFQDSSAILFDSLESALKDNFDEFYNLLSRERVIAGALEAELLGRIEDQVSPRRLGNIYSPRTPLRSINAMYPLIEDGVIRAFSDEISYADPDLLNKCYVQTPDRIKFDSRLKMYLNTKQPLFQRRPSYPLRGKRDAKSLDETIEKSVARSRPVAVLILGTVGAGKTTFLHYTRLVSSSEYFHHEKNGPYPHWIHVDFRDFIPSGNSSEFIYDTISKYIASDRFLSNYEQCIRPAYIDEIRQLKDGPLKLISSHEDKVNEKIADWLLEESKHSRYKDRLLSYAASKKPIFLVIDNIDQFSDEMQASIFSDSISLAHRNRLNLIVSLRDRTFVHHRHSAVFDAFDFDPIYIDPPAIPAILSKRFFLMKHILSGKSGNFVAENGARIEVNDISNLVDLIQSSVTGTTIGSIISLLSAGDIRLGLRMTREFLESGYTNPGRAVTIFQRTGKYMLPRHEAMRSILLGKHPTYSESFSVIGNPFDAHLSKTNAQLIRMFILNGLVTLSGSKTFRSVEGTDISEYNRAIGFSDEIVERILVKMCDLRFIATTDNEDPSLASSYFPTRLGGYVIRYLMANFTFLEATMMDTFISNENTWEDLKIYSEQIDAERNTITRLKIRIKRAETFFNHMKLLYSAILTEAQRRALPAEWCNNPFDDIESSFKRNLERALSSAIRNYSR
jgi:GTPase SAR1 family protein